MGVSLRGGGLFYLGGDKGYPYFGNYPTECVSSKPQTKVSCKGLGWRVSRVSEAGGESATAASDLARPGCLGLIPSPGSRASKQLGFRSWLLGIHLQGPPYESLLQRFFDLRLFLSWAFKKNEQEPPAMFSTLPPPSLEPSHPTPPLSERAPSATAKNTAPA